MFAYVLRHVFLSHNPVIRTTKSVPMHLRLHHSSVPSPCCHEQFIPPQAQDGGSRSSRVSPSEAAVYGRRAANVVQRRLCCLPSFWRTAPAVVQRTLCRDDSAHCRRSGVLLLPSCSECCVETTLPSAVVQAYCYGCRDRLSSHQGCRLARDVLASPRCVDSHWASRLCFQSPRFSRFTRKFLICGERIHL